MTTIINYFNFNINFLFYNIILNFKKISLYNQKNEAWTQSINLFLKCQNFNTLYKSDDIIIQKLQCCYKIK